MTLADDIEDRVDHALLRVTTLDGPQGQADLLCQAICEHDDEHVAACWAAALNDQPDVLGRLIIAKLRETERVLVRRRIALVSPACGDAA